jgi:hypothetical protein
MKIWQFYAEKDLIAANKILDKIYLTGKNIKYPQQYQIDETLGNPFRRMIVMHFKIIYVEFDNKILITNIFDTRQDPSKLKL